MCFRVFSKISRYWVGKSNLNLLRAHRSGPLKSNDVEKLPITSALAHSHTWSARNCYPKRIGVHDGRIRLESEKHDGRFFQVCDLTHPPTLRTLLPIISLLIDTEKYDGHYRHSHSKSNRSRSIVAAAMLSFSLFNISKEEDIEETPEDKLVATIKRSILCIQREQFDKAEQMLHLALRMAQDIQSCEGITYVYDLMANLAMEREQFKKAEKLFAEVMKRLLIDGHADDSPQMLHISAKLAHMAQLQGDLNKSALGFEWTIQKIEQKLKEMPEDRDLQELFGLTKNWFGQLLMKIGKYINAKKAFKEAFDCLVDAYGQVNEEAITILNNLSVACVNLDEFNEAKKHLKTALEFVKNIKDSTQESILEANLGLVFLREGLLTEAKEHCALAYRMAKKQKNIEATEQAEYCLDEIKTYVKQK